MIYYNNLLLVSNDVHSLDFLQRTMLIIQSDSDIGNIDLRDLGQDAVIPR